MATRILDHHVICYVSAFVMVQRRCGSFAVAMRGDPLDGHPHVDMVGGDGVLQP